MNYVTADTYKGLRQQALDITAEAIHCREEVFGVIMETGYPEAVVTLVALADGTASLYFSNGGGMIGAGAHDGPAVAARTLVSFAGHHLGSLAPALSTPLPEPEHTRFYVLSKRGVLTAEAREADLGENRHALSPLFYTAQELITEMRMIDEARN